MATRTAPTVSGTLTDVTATGILLSIRFIDYQGQNRSHSLTLPSTVTLAEIEAGVAAIAALTNASVYEVVVGLTWAGEEDSDNATEDVWTSVADAVNTTMRSPTPQLANQIGVLPAPVQAMFIENTQTIDPTYAAYATYLGAILALVNGGAGGSGNYTVSWCRFSQHSQSNERIPI